MSNTDATPPGQWPDAALWPADDAPPREWAAFYRDHLREIVVPTPGLRDVLAHANSIANKAAADWALDHGGSIDAEVPDEVAAQIWDDARETAESNVGRPIGYIYTAWMRKVVVASDVTDAMLDEAWSPMMKHARGPRAEADHRGIAIVPRRYCLVDVDVGHGDEVSAGDLDGPWGWGLPGPKASTPRGGLHTLLVASGKETASADLGPGVDVVAGGGGTAIPLPAGSATPDRRWLRRDAPVAAPPELSKRGRRKAPPRPGALAGAPGAAHATHTDREPGDDWDDAPGQTAALVAAECGDGERNRVAPAIVGMLARPYACPPDFVRACLEMLAEEMAGRDCRGDDVQAEAARWRHLLTRGPRDVDFAAEVLEVWYRVRVTATGRWKTTPRKLAASVWKVCDRREEGRAGAEDFGEGPDLGTWPARRGESFARGPADAPHGEQAAESADQVPFPPPSPEQAQRAVEASKSATVGVAAVEWRGGVDPRQYSQSLADAYTDADLDRDLEREPIQIGKVFPAVDFATGHPLDGSPDRVERPLWHGWGEYLGGALGGLAPSDFVVIGAAGAGAGKTWFECWLMHGLAIATAARLLGWEGYENAPLVLPVWVSEMPKRSELYLRAAVAHLGFDMACITAGRAAHESPGVVAHASRLHGWTPHQVVDRARLAERAHGRDPRLPLCVARHHVIKNIALTRLPRLTRKAGVVLDHRSGPVLMDHVADAIDYHRAELAAAAGVTPDKVLPVAVIDPGQRFAGTGQSERQMIDALFGAANDVLCKDLGAAVVTTSDTTKAAVRSASTIDVFLSAPHGPLGADIFAGSQGIQHHAGATLAIQSEPVAPGAHTVRTWLRMFKNRSGVLADVAYPFTWEMALGRYRADPPEPLRAPVERDDDRAHHGGLHHPRPARRNPGPPPGSQRVVYLKRGDFGVD